MRTTSLIPRKMTQELNVTELLDKWPRLWVFGYGSLIWKQGFTYQSSQVGYIKGFVRRFWQGNVTHRGTPESPGRVATLVPEESGCVWGVAYEVVGRSNVMQALAHLGVRECKLGGYSVQTVSFQPRDCENQTLPVLVFNATPDNHLYLGETSLDNLALEIIYAKGNSGHNIEYVTQMANHIRARIPEDTDNHLFGLDSRIRHICACRNICIDSIIEESRPLEVSPGGHESRTTSDHQNNSILTMTRLKEIKQVV